ncbi:hypothetical protein G6F68_019701 [Rhizopus microsporus]|nr:hypothetical protein G6F68_019701 [Rhizopus microsporus]
MAMVLKDLLASFIPLSSSSTSFLLGQGARTDPSRPPALPRMLSSRPSASGNPLCLRVSLVLGRLKISDPFWIREDGWIVLAVTTRSVKRPRSVDGSRQSSRCRCGTASVNWLWMLSNKLSDAL